MTLSSRSEEAAPPEPSDVPGVAAYLFGRFRLDLLCHQLLQDDQVVPLSAKAFDVLVTLVRRRDRTVTKDDLIRSVWHDAFVSEENLTQAIYVLRRALGDDSSNPQYIVTVARRGYRFIAPVTENPVEAPAAPGPTQTAPAAVAPPPSAPSEPVAPVAPARRSGRGAIAAVAAGVVLLAVLGGAALLLNRDDAPAQRFRFTEIAPAGTVLVSGAVASPDSRFIAFVAREEAAARTLLWVKTLDTGEVRGLMGTDGAFRPFWAPDSSALGFFAGGRLRIVGIEDGIVRTIAATGVTPTGGTWNAAGTILFADISSPVFSVSAAGGQPVAITSLDESGSETGHRRPQFLPDGRRFLFVVNSTDGDKAGTWVGSLDSAERSRVMRSSSVVFAPPDQVLFVRDGALMSQRVELSTLELMGNPVRVAVGVVPESAVNSTAISASAGLLTFGGGTSAEHLAWFDRTGRRLDVVDSPAKLHDPTLSVDGTQLLAESATPETRGIWRVDIDRGSATRLVTDGTMAMMSPDGALIAYSATRPGAFQNIYVRSATDDTRDEPLIVSNENKYVGDWGRDGRLVFVSRRGQNTDIRMLEPGQKEPVDLIGSPANEIQPSISPDSRWIAYVSDESGRWEVYVQAFPGLGGKRAISVGGGVEPLWRKDGRELFYLAADHTLTAMDVGPGETLAVGPPRPLFPAPISWNAPLYRSFYRRHYAASSDGSRFAFAAVDPGGADPISIVVNWRTSGANTP